MYYYKNELHYSKPSGIEFKTNVRGVSVFVGLTPNQTIKVSTIGVKSNQDIETFLVIETDGPIRSSFNCLDVGKYRMLHNHGDLMSLSIMDGYNVTQKVVLENKNTRGVNVQLSKCGNISVSYANLFYVDPNNLNHPVYVPSSVTENGVSRWFRYKENKNEYGYLISITFLGIY